MFAQTVTITQNANGVEKILYQKSFSNKYPKDKMYLCEYKTAVKEQEFKCPSSFEFREGIVDVYAVKLDLSFLTYAAPTKVATGYVEANIEMQSDIQYPIYKKELFIKIDD
jgi:hypothetical protein